MRALVGDHGRADDLVEDYLERAPLRAAFCLITSPDHIAEFGDRVDDVIGHGRQGVAVAGPGSHDDRQTGAAGAGEFGIGDRVADHADLVGLKPGGGAKSVEQRRVGLGVIA